MYCIAPAGINSGTECRLCCCLCLLPRRELSFASVGCILLFQTFVRSAREAVDVTLVLFWDSGRVEVAQARHLGSPVPEATGTWPMVCSSPPAYIQPYQVVG